MTTGKTGAVGHAPSVLIGSAENPERAKYEKMWAHDEYRVVSPGEQIAQEFLKQAKPPPDSEVIDFGCGTGRGALMLALFGRMKVTMVDFAENCLDKEVADACLSQPDRMKFIAADLSREGLSNYRRPVCAVAAYGYCCDMMEHVPEADIDRVLINIMSTAQHVFFQISTQPDVMGAMIDETLHMTVKPFSWWLDKLKEHKAVVHWSEERDNCALFYVSTWVSCQEIVDGGVINTELEKLQANIRTNLAKGLEQCVPHGRQEREVVLLGGGPSLADYTDEIIASREAGMALVTTNGAYNWAVEHGLEPSAQVIVDSREFNRRFVEPPLDSCRYLLASQTHPSLSEGLNQVMLWHACLDDDTQKILDQHYDKKWYAVPGGSTVVLRAICLLRMLGFYKFHVYGLDSCLLDDEHHAFTQAENDDDSVIPVSCNGKVFSCHPWMASQAQEFMGLVKMLGDEVLLDIKGNGLIAHIIATGAELEDLSDGSNSLGLI